MFAHAVASAVIATDGLRSSGQVTGARTARTWLVRSTPPEAEMAAAVRSAAVAPMP